jgi:hypothetical protein
MAKLPNCFGGPKIPTLLTRWEIEQGVKAGTDSVRDFFPTSGLFAVRLSES